MKRFGKLVCFLALIILSSNYSCRETVAASCNYTLELENETNALTAAATTYAQDPSSANCEAYRQAYLEFLDEAEKLDNCVIGTERDAYRQAIDSAQAGLDALTC